MSKQAVAAIANLRPIFPAGLKIGSAAPPRQIPRVPGIPFFRDPNHTVPTRQLYRQLLRSTSHARRGRTNESGTAHANQAVRVNWDALGRKLKAEWRKRRGWTSIPQTQAFLETQRAFLESISSNSTPSQELIDLSHKLADQQRRAAERAVPKPSPRPYVAGFHRPTTFNPPLPRLKPQPLSLSMMILRRVRARERRVALQRDLRAQAQEIKEEIDFFRRVRDRAGLEDAKGFLLDLRGRQADLQVLFDRHEERKAGVFSEAVVRRVMKARRERQAFKRRRAEERKREIVTASYVL